MDDDLAPPLAGLRLVETQDLSGALWSGAVALYEAAFPAWEREPVDKLEARIRSGRYLFGAALDADDAVIGFHILDYPPHGRFGLFSFLAVRETQRSRGVGAWIVQRIVQDRAIADRAPWLFIEAEDRQAAFYGRLGFRKIDTPYAVPAYDGDGVEPMHLLVYNFAGAEAIAADFLRRSVTELFVDGYYLDPGDPRIAAQAAAMPPEGMVRLLAWPPAG